jgi:hypothetical protein
MTAIGNISVELRKGINYLEHPGKEPKYLQLNTSGAHSLTVTDDVEDATTLKKVAKSFANKLDVNNDIGASIKQ